MKVIITEHARRRLETRCYISVEEARARAEKAARRGIKGRVALTGTFPHLVVDIRRETAVVVTALWPGMRIRKVKAFLPV